MAKETKEQRDARELEEAREAARERAMSKCKGAMVQALNDNLGSRLTKELGTGIFTVFEGAVGEMLEELKNV